MSRQTEIAAQIPWVTRLDEPSPGGCIGMRSDTPLKALYRWGAGKANPPVGLADYRCRNSARWHFKALENMDTWEHVTQSGDYCWSHLVHQCLYGTHPETERTVKWTRENGYLE